MMIISELPPLTEDLKMDIRRKFILSDAIKEGHKAKFSHKKSLKVTHNTSCCTIHSATVSPVPQISFVGQSSVDTGGPRREFLRLLASEASDSLYFRRGDEGAFFSCNTTAFKVLTCIKICAPKNLIMLLFQNNDYLILGLYALMSLVQGGPGFPFLHPHVYAYLCTGTWSPCSHCEG